MKLELKVAKGEWEKMTAWAAEAYPNEGCGIMAGLWNPKRVLKIYKMTNTNTDRSHDRYVLDPKEFEEVQKQIAQEKMDVIGFYHTHPDHPAMPSAFDTNHAWAEYSYIIIAVNQGKVKKARSWALDEGLREFFEETIHTE